MLEAQNNSEGASLPASVSKMLNELLEAAGKACGDNLVSAVLYGSAAEGRMRATSDVNLILVFKEFRVAEIDPLRELLRIGAAAMQLKVMFLEESEIALATEAFAVKFSDIHNRHRVLFGSDPFATLSASREATLRRLRQVIVNLILRMRERYALMSLREEQLAKLVAESAGPLRSCAATIRQLEGLPAEQPKEALQALCTKFPGGPWEKLLQSLSKAREERILEPGEGLSAVLGLMKLLHAMLAHLEGLG